MTSVLLLGDDRKGGAANIVHEFADWLRGITDRVEVVVDRESSLEDIDVDFVMVFGGDGSLLGAARRMGRNQLPTVGVNLGRLGFLTSFERDQAREAAEVILRGELEEQPRLLLDVHVEDADGKSSDPVLCMNDAVVVRSASGGMATVTARQAGLELATYSGDGLIAATPAGSTAYSMAAGGPVLTPDLEALVLTPLASHTLSVRPLVVPTRGGIQIEVIETGGPSTCHLVVDGQVQLEVPAGGQAILCPADISFRHLSFGNEGFFKVLRHKFGWADVPRERHGRG